MNIKAILFDLDYTLYDQRQFLLGSFDLVAHTIALQCAHDQDQLYQSLIAQWQRFGVGYPRLFDDWLALFGIVDARVTQAAVQAFHIHQPKTLKPYDGVTEMLERLKQHYKIGIITDGNVIMQQTKVAALGFTELMDVTIYTKSLQLAKPHQACFRSALQALDLLPEQALYAGDHPIRDIAGARQTGMLAVRVLTGEYKNLPDDALPPHFTVAHVSAVEQVVRSVQ